MTRNTRIRAISEHYSERYFSKDGMFTSLPSDMKPLRYLKVFCFEGILLRKQRWIDSKEVIAKVTITQRGTVFPNFTSLVNIYIVTLRDSSNHCPPFDSASYYQSKSQQIQIDASFFFLNSNIIDTSPGKLRQGGFALSNFCVKILVQRLKETLDCLHENMDLKNSGHPQLDQFHYGASSLDELSNVLQTWSIMCAASPDLCASVHTSSPTNIETTRAYPWRGRPPWRRDRWCCISWLQCRRTCAADNESEIYDFHRCATTIYLNAIFQNAQGLPRSKFVELRNLPITGWIYLIRFLNT
jgi:hypothetical protein